MRQCYFQLADATYSSLHSFSHSFIQPMIVRMIYDNLSPAWHRKIFAEKHTHINKSKPFSLEKNNCLVTHNSKFVIVQEKHRCNSFRVATYKNNIFIISVPFFSTQIQFKFKPPISKIFSQQVVSNEWTKSISDVPMFPHTQPDKSTNNFPYYPFLKVQSNMNKCMAKHLPLGIIKEPSLELLQHWHCIIASQQNVPLNTLFCLN